ncbi:MFS transporter [Komagataeibacter nataicola]|nr:MFS transporter [Komagataeibacter nataicola]WEQ54487.1 MFS transporter [Komagataeibacter nataicola]WNM08863.1 MFS transporter [Komagataeibacter nataicola]GBR17521.1 major facilitator superfamily transporter [Komagataeibacter nataicola NRIC 0616]
MSRIALASMVGTTLEWYDFMIYNTMSALVFSQLFFPGALPMVGTLLAFSTYAVGYISRPLGGVVFGRLGDRLGRGRVLTLTVVCMGVCTGLIAILPTYHAVGIVSPLILVMLRLVQGIALGGEWAGAVLLGVEHGHASRRGLHAAWAQMGPGAGTLMSTAVIACIAGMVSNAQFMAWGWRIPFALSGLLALVGLWLRHGITEPGSFEKLRRTGGIARSPVIHLLRHHMRAVCIAASSRIGPDVLYALLVVFSLTYITQVRGLPRSVILCGMLSGSALSLPATVGFGMLADRVGVKKLFLAAICCALPFVCVFFPLMNTGTSTIIIVTVTVGLIVHAAMYAVQGAFITACFPAVIRYSGSSVSYTFGSLAGGGAFAPLIMTALFRTSHPIGAIVLYVVAAFAATACGLLFCNNIDGMEHE